MNLTLGREIDFLFFAKQTKLEMIGLNWTPLALSSPTDQSGFTKIEIARRFLILITNFGEFLMYTFKEMTSC